jgi:hypothetical protein
MNRRRLLLGLGSLATGTAASVSTGAFSSVRAERDVRLDVADDADAFLGLSPGEGPNGAYARTDDGTLGVDLNAVNVEAVTKIDDVCRVTNTGTQPVWVWTRITSGGFKTEYYLYDSADGTPLSLPKSAATLSGRAIRAQYLDVGESVDVGISLHVSGQFGRKRNRIVVNARSDRAAVPDNIGSEDPA